MRNVIILLGLNYEYNVEIGQLVAQKSDLYFLDAKEYINYNLFSRKDMLEKCGIDYLQNQENSVIKSCADFENTIIAMPYMYFFRNKMYNNFLDKSYIVYLNFSYNKLKSLSNNVSDDSMLDLNLLAFDDRNDDMKKICDVKINVSNKKKETIVNEILNFYRGEK